MKACTQCGRCCTNSSFMGTLTASGADVQRWRKQRRYDILRWVSVIGPPSNPWGDLWIHPVRGDDRERCPFVRKIRGQDRYTCTIYDTRPDVCRSYPHHVDHMMSVNCEMLDEGDTDADVRRFMANPK
jgi:Fe-S-cluster containining protein